MAIEAVVFDLDGVLIDSEAVWNAARKEVAESHGGLWLKDAQREMMGMSSTEWSSYMHDKLGVELSPEEISAAVVSRLEDPYRKRLPLLQRAREAMIALARVWRLALASSGNRPIIELVLDLAGLAQDSRRRCPPKKYPGGSPPPTCIWRLPAGSTSRHRAAWRSRIGVAASAARPRRTRP